MRIVPAHRSLVIVVLAMAMFACSDSGTPSQPATHSTVKAMPFKHTNGLTLALPDGAFRVEESAAGFRIEPPDAASMRNPLAIEIVLRVGEPLAPMAGGKTSRPRRRALSNRGGGGGSGGDEHALTAWIPCPTGYVVVHQIQQLEPPEEPDFSPAWTVLGAAHCERPTTRN
jgi:hypothetical protein